MHPTYLVGLLASFLPTKLQPDWLQEYVSDLRSPAILSGLVQMFGCLAALILGYKPFVESQFQQIDHRAVTAGVEAYGETSLMGMGMVIAVAYLLRPLTLALFYFSFEGAIRAIAAFVSGESIGTLPLYLLLIVQRKTGKQLREFKLGARTPPL